MNYMQIEAASVSNGLGFRVVLWVSGCALHCACCHNPETWDFYAGKQFTEHTKKCMFEALNKEWVKGITFSGGHPLEPQNIETVSGLIAEIRRDFPGKDIWLYTGLDLTMLDFMPDSPLYTTLSGCDVVVDGRYINEQRNITLPFRGSSNQRIIDVKKTLATNQIVELEIT